MVRARSWSAFRVWMPIEGRQQCGEVRGLELDNKILSCATWQACHAQTHVLGSYCRPRSCDTRDRAKRRTKSLEVCEAGHSLVSERRKARIGRLKVKRDLGRKHNSQRGPTYQH